MTLVYPNGTNPNGTFGTGTILHIGQDICRRIPVMEAAGFTVVQSENYVDSIHSQLIKISFSAITFHCDVHPLQDEVVRATRDLSVAPLVLFENPSVQCDESPFDLVILNLTQPRDWLRGLSDAIEEGRQLCVWSRQLCLSSEKVRSESKALRARARRLRISPFDPDSAWRSEPT